MSDGVSYEFCPPDKGGLVRIDPNGARTPVVREEVPEPTAQPVQQPVLKAHVPGVSPWAQRITPKHVIRAAKQRLKEIRAQLKNNRALLREEAQLETMLKAAQKPTHVAEVRPLASRK